MIQWWSTRASLSVAPRKFSRSLYTRRRFLMSRDDFIGDATTTNAAEAITPLIEAREVSFAYSVAPVIVDVSLALPQGKMGALIGANGSGKSTLIRLLAGLIQPVSGVVAFNDMPLSKFEARERAKRIAYVPQASPTVFPFTALEVV